MANRNFKPGAKCIEAGTIKLYGKVTTTTSGTIGSQSCKGFSVAKTASETGRYTVTLEDKYTGLLGCAVVVEGAADAAYTTAKGLQAMLRGVAVDQDTPLFYIQFVNGAQPQADAEVDDAAVFYIEITLKNSSVEY